MALSVIGFGLGRTGTFSLRLALNELGFVEASGGSHIVTGESHD